MRWLAFFVAVAICVVSANSSLAVEKKVATTIASSTPTSSVSSTATTTIEVPSWFGQAYAWVMERGGNRLGQAKNIGVWLMEQGQSLLDQQAAIRAVAVERFKEFQDWLQKYLGWGKATTPTVPAE